MDHGVLLTGSVWSLFEKPQGRWAEGCSGRGCRVVSSLLQGHLTWQLLVLTMVGNLELEGGSLGKQWQCFLLMPRERCPMKHIQSSAEVGLNLASHMME